MSFLGFFSISLQHKTYMELAGSGGVGGEAKTDLQESCKCNCG